MIWIGLISAIGVGALLLSIRSGSGRTTVRAQIHDAQARAELLTEEKQEKMAGEMRSLAKSGYTAIATAALDAGKSASFAHQVGVLQALSLIIANGRTLSNDESVEIQAEAMPFILQDSSSGCDAVVEYLIWKLLPLLANQELFAPALLGFQKRIYEDSLKEVDVDNFIFSMLFSMKYDWQRWLIAYKKT